VPVETCTVITTDANKLMEPIHDRMPVILPPCAYDLWLDVAVQEPERLTPLPRPYCDEMMETIHGQYARQQPEEQLARVR
jgi:putative SOS response-associated peptidase YedK